MRRGVGPAQGAVRNRGLREKLSLGSRRGEEGERGGGERGEEEGRGGEGKGGRGRQRTFEE